MTFDNFADILVMSRVIAPEAIWDPDNYDDSCTLENVRAAYRRLTTPTDVLADDWLVESRKPGVEMPTPTWTRHEHGYGFVCSCGYHGKTQIGREVHRRRGCSQNEPPKGRD